VPPTTVDGLTVTVESAGPGGGASGFTVKVANLVTPPPDTDIVTTVCAGTWCREDVEAAVRDSGGTMTLLFT